MKHARLLATTITIAATTLATGSWAAGNAQHDSHHPATPSMGMSGMAAMPGYAEQMKAMQTMHDQMMAAKTTEERNALMAEHMKLMQGGMGMMGRMGPGAMAGKSGDMVARQGMLEQRMDMMQSMMQMMVDRMAPAPASK